MQLLHCMLRISNPDESLAFFQECLGLSLVRSYDDKANKFSLYYLSYSDNLFEIELTHNWGENLTGSSRNFGHIAISVPDIYQTCKRIIDFGVEINRPPRDGYMAFIKTPDGVSIELLQQGSALPPTEPWISMVNIGEW